MRINHVMVCHFVAGAVGVGKGFPIGGFPLGEDVPADRGFVDVVADMISQAHVAFDFVRIAGYREAAALIRRIVYPPNNGLAYSRDEIVPIGFGELLPGISAGGRETVVVLVWMAGSGIHGIIG